MRLNISKNLIVQIIFINNVDAYIEYNPTEDNSKTIYLVFTSTGAPKRQLLLSTSFII